jgi:Probable lipid transfer
MLIMGFTQKYLLLAVVLVLVATIGLDLVSGAGECGKVSPDSMALKMTPCAQAAQDPKAKVSPKCCAEVQAFGKNPRCLCAVLLSNAAKKAGIKPEIAITIPKRCNLAKRPVGYKCGRMCI